MGEEIFTLHSKNILISIYLKWICMGNAAGPGFFLCID